MADGAPTMRNARPCSSRVLFPLAVAADEDADARRQKVLNVAWIVPILHSHEHAWHVSQESFNPRRAKFKATLTAHHNVGSNYPIGICPVALHSGFKAL